MTLTRGNIRSLISKIHKNTPKKGMDDDVPAVIRRAEGGPITKKNKNWDKSYPKNEDEEKEYIDSRLAKYLTQRLGYIKRGREWSEKLNNELYDNPPEKYNILELLQKEAIEGNKERLKDISPIVDFWRRQQAARKEIDYGSKFAKGGYTGGNQPAALSEGEYVIPADVVSMLGDGNSDAGAKILDQFCKQIRKEKGKHLARGEQAPPLK